MLDGEGLVGRAGGRLLWAGLAMLARRTELVGWNPSRAYLEEIRYERGALVIFYYWVRDVVPLLVGLKIAAPEIGSLGTFVSAQSILGRAVSDVLFRLGQTSVRIRTTDSGGVAVPDVLRLLRRNTALLMTADGRGAPGAVPIGLARLADARCAVGIPVGVDVSAGLRISLRGRRIVVPGPGSRVAVAFGAAVDPQGDGAIERLSNGLQSAHVQAGELLCH